MTSHPSCPSLLELLDVRLGDADPELAAHVNACARCQLLLAELPDQAPEVDAVSAARTTVAAARRRPSAIGDWQASTGELWQAAARPDADRAWVVAVIGRRPNADDVLVVAPISPDVPAATEVDLLLDRELLGYRAFVDMANAGSLLRSQLIEPIGALDHERAEELVAMWRHVLAGQPAPEGEHGAPVLEPDDPRVLLADERAEALRELWRPLDALVDVQDAPGSEVPSTDTPVVHLTFAQLLEQHLDGPDAEWDEVSLLEDSGADSDHLLAFRHDRLDLTDQGDAEDVARVVRSLDVPWEEVQPALILSLDRSAGGMRSGHGQPQRLAARSSPGMNADQVARILYRDQSRVDDSQQARAGAIALYLAAVSAALDDLD